MTPKNHGGPAPCATHAGHRNLRSRPLSPALWALALLAALCAGACLASGGSLRKKLSFSAMQFNSGVRWRAHKRVASVLHPKIRDKYLDQAEKGDDKINVSAVDLLRITLSKGNHKAVLRYRYQWHRASVGLLRKTIVVQYWRWRKKSWQVLRVKHASGRKFPLFKGLDGKTKKPKPRSVPPRRKTAPARP